MIERRERDRKIEELNHEITVYQNLLMDAPNNPAIRPDLDPDTVMDLVQPFSEWEFLSRDERRAVLRMLCCKVNVFRYEIKSLRLSLPSAVTDSHTDSHSKTEA